MSSNTTERSGIEENSLEMSEEKSIQADIKAGNPASPDHSIFNFQVPSAKFSGQYELMGVVTHKGRSADSGHYMSWVRQHPGSNFWWKFDDEKVSEVTTSEILDLKGGADWHIAYLNIYRFKEI